MATLAETDDPGNRSRPCTGLEPRNADLNYLKQLFSSDCWEQIRSTVLKHVAHWHCCWTVLYYTEQHIKRKFGVSIPEFHNASVVRLDETFRKYWQVITASATLSELDKEIRACFLRSLGNARYELLAERERRGSLEPLPAEVEDRRHQEFSVSTFLDVQQLLICISKLPPKQRVVVREAVAGRPTNEIAKLVRKSAGHVSRIKAKGIKLVRKCLGGRS